MFRSRNGFTLIELLIVITMIGVLSGVLVAVINAPRKRQEAEDAVKLSRLQELASGLETARIAEGSYPANATDAIMSTYVGTWPTDFIYRVNLVDDTMSVHFIKSIDISGSSCFKYSSRVGIVMDCATCPSGTLVTDCGNL